MKLPLTIKAKLIKIHKISAEHKKLDTEIRAWFEKQGIYNDSVIDPYIDTVDMQDGDIETFIKMLENDDFNKGNNVFYVG